VTRETNARRLQEGEQWTAVVEAVDFEVVVRHSAMIAVA
jgi:hypothetical protein